MGRLIAAVYDKLTEASEVACLQQWRAELLRDLAGHVLEVGAGTGLNVPFYPPAITRLVLSEPDHALAEIHRVLRPGGRLLFLEHVAALDRPRRLRWQHRVEPLWRRIAGNCHLTRRTADAIGAAGFAMADVRRESMRKAWPLVRPTIRGVAVKP